jgi:chromosome segregation ATPase
MKSRVENLTKQAEGLLAHLQQLTLENTRLKRRYTAVLYTCRMTQAVLANYATYKQRTQDLIAILKTPADSEQVLQVLDKQIQQLLSSSQAHAPTEGDNW